MVGGYVILGRTLDKCRALLGDKIGEYHFDCPLDNMLFGWKRIMGDDFKAAVAEGKSDEEMLQWVVLLSVLIWFAFIRIAPKLSMLKADCHSPPLSELMF